MESEDYETNRNLTLMFFLEKLLDKGGGSRSLHDLSCQFGTKGFSREMRQIAGGSQAGLRRFFKQYPSLFTVEGKLKKIVLLVPLPVKKIEVVEYPLECCFDTCAGCSQHEA